MILIQVSTQQVLNKAMVAETVSTFCQCCQKWPGPPNPSVTWTCQYCHTISHPRVILAVHLQLIPWTLLISPVTTSQNYLSSTFILQLLCARNLQPAITPKINRPCIHHSIFGVASSSESPSARTYYHAGAGPSLGCTWLIGFNSSRNTFSGSFSAWFSSPQKRKGVWWNHLPNHPI